MTAAGAGLFSALAVMLGLAVLARALARRLGWVRPAARGRLRMEVVQRLALSPKQGLAVVRIGDRLVAVSMGDGGVRPVLELADADVSALATPAVETAAAPAPVRFSVDALVPVLAAGITRLRQRSRPTTQAAALPSAGTAPGVDAAPEFVVKVVNAETQAAASFAEILAESAAETAVDQVMEIADEQSAEPVVGIETAPAMDEVMEIAEEQVIEPVMEIVAAPVVDQEMEIAVEQMAEPVMQVVAEEIAEPVMQIVAEQTAEPVMQIAAEPVAEITAEAVIEPIAEPVVEPVIEVAAEAAAEPVVETAAEVKPAPKQTRGRRAKPAADAPPAKPAAARAARRSGKSAAKKTGAVDAPMHTVLRAAAVLLIAISGSLLPARAAAQDGGVPGMEEIAEATRQEIGAVTQAAAALQQGAPAADPSPAGEPSAAPRPAPRRPIAGTVKAKADSAFAGAPRLDVSLGGEEDGLKLSGTVGVVVMMGLLSLIPALVLMMTGFTRILIVLHFLRQALGTQTAPPAHLIGAMALLLTGFVMGPTLSEVNRTALQPWLNGQMDEAQMLQVGQQPFREFMLRQTRESDVALFVELSRSPAPESVDQVPLTVLASAFVTSELRTAFQMGFVLFLPFIVIDLVVASVLMSMGMMMLPPAMIALPFKLLLFVLVDGWALVVQGLVTSFR